MTNNAFQRWISAIVAIRTGQLHIAQHRGAEAVGIFQPVAFSHTSNIAYHGIEAAGSAWTEWRQANGMEFLIAEQTSRVTAGALRLPIEKLKATFLSGREGRLVTCQVFVKRAVVAFPLNGLESSKRIGNFGNCHFIRCVYVVKRFDKQASILGYDAHAFGKDRPGRVDAIMHCSGNFVFSRIACHLELGDKRKDRLCSKQGFKAFWQPLFRWRIETVFVGVGDRQTPIVKERVKVFCTEIPKAWRVSRNPFLNSVAAFTGRTFLAKPGTAFADAK